MANPIDLNCSRQPSEPDAGGLPLGPDELPGVDADTMMRSARQAAWIRYEAYSSSTAEDVSFGCDPPRVDFDHCGTVRVRNPILFHSSGSDGASLSIHDVKQRLIGDCSLMAVLAGLADTVPGRDLLRSVITENKDKYGQVSSYTVVLHRPFFLPGPAVPLLAVGIKTSVQVSPDYAKGHARLASDQDKRVVWPAVIEKAVAQLLGGYNPIDGDWVARALLTVTGDSGHTISLRWLSYTAAEIRRDLQSQKIVILQTPSELPADAQAAGLIAEHAYYVRRMDEGSGSARLTLHNPWDESHPSPIPIEALRHWFAAATVGSVKGGPTP